MSESDFDFMSELTQRKRRLKAQAGIISKYLGTDRTEDTVICSPGYYGELLAWALAQHIRSGKWRIVKAMGNKSSQPQLFLVDTGDGKGVSLYRSAILFLEKGSSRLALTVSICPPITAMVTVSSSLKVRKKAHGFCEAVSSIMREQNFYRGRSVEYNGTVRLIHPQPVTWDSIILDRQVKRDVRMNTTGFLKNYERLAAYGIPPKRGVMLVGDPGTGKTLICKAIMAESESITCITVSAYDMDNDDYIVNLYALASDLSPAIVIFEDIDLIAQDREESRHSRAPALMALLAAMDGIESCEMIVTVATTNYPDLLDKAVKVRPSRFDRVIQVSLPSTEQRLELVSSMTDRIYLHPAAQISLAQRTEGCTPAQIKEIVYSLVMDRLEDGDMGEELPMFTESEIEKTVARVKGGVKKQMGFVPHEIGHDRGALQVTGRCRREES